MKKLIIITALAFFSFTAYANDCFNMLDQDQNGCLSPREYAVLQSSVYPDIPGFNEIDADLNGCISLDEFQSAFICVVEEEE